MSCVLSLSSVHAIAYALTVFYFYLIGFMTLEVKHMSFVEWLAMCVVSI